MSAEQLPVTPEPQDTALPVDGLPQAIDANVKDWPEWYSRLPIKAQQILALVSLGMSNNSIERAFGLSSGVVDYYKKTYGRGRVLNLSPSTRSALQVAIIESKALQAAASISSADLDATQARDKAYIAKALAETADKLSSRGQAQTVEFTDLDNKLRVRIGK